MTNQIIEIAHNKLDIDPLNTRKTFSEKEISDFAEVIAVEGILQNLIGRKGQKGRYFVSGGQRRYFAVKHLIDQGKLPQDHPMPFKLVTKDEAQAMSLSENINRVAMAPMDQFEAFSALAEKGMKITDIAVRFATTETLVRQRLALARVAPELRDLYRNDEMTFEQLKAFTLTDDHAEQMRVWDTLPQHSKYASNIREALRGEGVPETNKRIAFIGGIEAYEAAGGEIKRDLFSETSGGAIAMDAALVEKLVAQQFEKTVEALKAEGWKWVETALDYDCNFDQKLGRVYPERIDLTEAEEAEREALTNQCDELSKQIEAGQFEDQEAAEAELIALEKKLDALEKEVYKSEDLEIAGVYAALNHLGQLRLERGLVRHEDMKKNSKDSESGATTDNTEENAPEDKAATLKHSAALLEDLTAQKTAALRLELANNSGIALAAVTHALLLQTVYNYGGSHYSSLHINLSKAYLNGSLKQPDDNKAIEEFERIAENFGDHIPGNPTDLWDWCLDRTRDELLELLAFAAAQSVNSVEGKFFEKSRINHANQLGQALNIDMHDYFEPTADNYFSQLNRASIGAAVAEAKGVSFADGVAAMKKAEAVTFAHKQLKGSGWLPSPILFGTPANDDQDSFPQAAE